MKSLPAEITAELAKEVMFIAHLYTIDLISGTHRWTDISNSIYYGGYWYISQGVSFEQAGTTLKSQADSATLNIQNVDKGFSDLMLSEDIKGRPVTIQRVFLDKNLAVIGAPVTIFPGYIDPAEANRSRAKVEIANHMIKWKLITPKRQHSITCPWTFKSAECAFTGNLVRIPISDILAGFTRSMGSLNYGNVNDYLTDLTIGATFTADTDDGAGNVIGNAFDDNPATYWQSGPTLPHTAEIHFAGAKTIVRYTLTPQAQATAPNNFTLQGSNDEATWIDIDSREGVSWPATPTNRMFEVRLPGSYSYYRLYIFSNYGGAGTSALNEMELIGDETQVNDVDYNYTNNTAAKSDLFGLSVISLAADATVANVTVRVRSKQGVAAARNVAGRIRMGGVDYDATGISPATSFTDYDFVWALNPVTGLAWTLSEIMGADLCSGGTPSVDSVYDTGREADKVFDNDLTTSWASANTAFPHWVRYQFPTEKVIKGYSIYPIGGAGLNQNMKDFKFQGSNNGTDWTDLDTRDISDWASGVRRYFGFTNSTSYTYYQLIATTNNGGANYCAFIEMEMFDAIHLQAFGYSTPADAGGHEVDVSECRIKISSDALWCDFTPERCEALNNRLNYGGFKYMSELAIKEYWWGAKQKVWTGAN